VGVELFHADGETGGQTDGWTDIQTDMMKLKVAIRNFENAPKKGIRLQISIEKCWDRGAGYCHVRYE
jgi:hypothetical protein